MTNEKQGMMFVLSSPSGAGKTTIARRLLAEDKKLRMSVSVTTRPPRQNEIGGTDYQFVDEEAFQKMLHNGELLEHATVFGYLYGTPRKKVETTLSQDLKDFAELTCLKKNSRSTILAVPLHLNTQNIPQKSKRLPILQTETYSHFYHRQIL